jgi:hypothetical protein
LIAPGKRYDILLTMPVSGLITAAVDYYYIRGDGTLSFFSGFTDWWVF